MTEFQQHVIKAIKALGVNATRDNIYRRLSLDLNQRLVRVAGPGSSSLAALYRQGKIAEHFDTGVWYVL